MIYRKIDICFNNRDFRKIIEDIDRAISELMAALAEKVLDANVAGYKMNTGQTNVEVTLSTENDVIAMINKLEQLREMYVNKAFVRRNGRLVLLKDQNNFRNGLI